MASRSKGSTKSSHHTKLSKALSWLLRHGAHECGVAITPAGFVKVTELLQLQQFNGYSERDIINVVENNDKQRFTLSTDEEGNLIVKANQGHSLEVKDLDLTEINPAELPAAHHGTFGKAIESIKAHGLSKMKRQHIHMIASLPGEGEVISGMRKSCDYIVTVNLSKAVADGLKFYRSPNGVILSPGDENGFIPMKYISSIKKRK